MSIELNCASGSLKFDAWHVGCYIPMSISGIYVALKGSQNILKFKDILEHGGAMAYISHHSFGIEVTKINNVTVVTVNNLYTCTVTDENLKPLLDGIATVTSPSRIAKEPENIRLEQEIFAEWLAKKDK